MRRHDRTVRSDSPALIDTYLHLSYNSTTSPEHLLGVRQGFTGERLGDHGKNVGKVRVVGSQDDGIIPEKGKKIKLWTKYPCWKQLGLDETTFWQSGNHHGNRLS